MRERGWWLVSEPRITLMTQIFADAPPFCHRVVGSRLRGNDGGVSGNGDGGVIVRIFVGKGASRGFGRGFMNGRVVVTASFCFLRVSDSGQMRVGSMVD